MNHQEKNQTSTHMSYVQLIPEQQINSSHQPANSSHQLANSSHQPTNSSHQPVNSSHQPVNSSHQTSIHNLPVITQSLANNRIYDNIVLYPGMW
jgi:hypothetical protein